MSICIGCGLEVDTNGILKVKLKPNGGIACDDTGLSVSLVPGGGGEGGGTIGGVPLGCALTSAGGTLNVDIGDAATCGGVVTNLLRCVDGDGLRADHNWSIASNSAACGYGSTFNDSIPTSEPGLPMVVSPVGYNFFTPIVQIKPDCICATANGTAWGWTGNTLFDAGGIQIIAAPNSRIEVSFDLHQGFIGDPITYGGLNPSYRVTIDNTNFGFPRRHDVVLHDTTWQIFGCGGIQLGMRLHVEVLAGSGTIFAYSPQQYEINWHYSHARPGTPFAPAPGNTQHNFVQGCTTPAP